MASSVDICNSGMSHLGGARRIASIDPADGSVEADLCASYYPLARAEMLEAADWTFARKRVALALNASNDSAVWAYAYALPSDCVKPRRVLTDGASNFDQGSEKFDVEGDVLYTNKEDAVLFYTRLATDTVKYSPLFVTALSYLMSSYLAGPVVKGDEGAKASANFRKIAMGMARGATASDANRSNLNQQAVPSGLLARNGAIGSTTPSTGAYGFESGYAIN